MDPIQLAQLSIFAVLLFLVIIIAWLVIWICTIVYQAKRSQWVWMVFTLIFNITLIIYWIVWLVYPKLRRKRK